MVEKMDVVVVEETGLGLFQVSVRTGEAAFFADEPVRVGGLSSGPDPFELIGAALAACTVMTMRLYARRKGWRMARLGSSVRHSKASASAPDRFERLIRVDPRLDDEQQARLLQIANRCPVHQMLEKGAEIITHLGCSDLPFPLTGALHGRIIGELCASPHAPAQVAS